jgi:hypothetical protein
LFALSDVQDYAAKILRKLVCARHDQLHWLIGREYPKVSPEKVMRQLGYLGKAMNDGQHYFWPGGKVNHGMIAAVDIMLRICGGSLPIFDTGPHPCALIFFLMQADRMQPFIVYTPDEGAEAECMAVAESRRDPKGHAAVFYIQSKRQIPLLTVSRPHVFAISDGCGGFDFLDAKL